MRHVSRETLRRLLALLVPTVLVLAAGLWGLWLRERVNNRKLARQLGQATLDTQARILDREFEGAISTLLFLADQPTLRRALERGGSRAELEAAYAQLCFVSEFVERVQVFDEEGRELVRVDREESAPATEEPPAVAAASALAPGEVYSSGFEVERVEGDRVHAVVRFATPVVGAGGSQRALLVLSCVAQELLDQLARGARDLPGWCALVNETGYYVEATHGPPSWGFAKGEAPTFRREFPRGWVDMQERARNQLDGRRGILSYLDWRPNVGGELPPGASDFRVRIVSFLTWERIYASSRRLGRWLVLGGALGALVLLGVGWPMAYAGALRRVHEREREENERRLRRLAARTLEVQEDERRSLSRDLHDELGQLGTAAKIELDRALRATDPERKDARLRAASDATDRLLGGLHDLASALRTTLLDDLGLESAVRAYAEEVEAHHGLAVELDVAIERDDELPPAVAIAAYRLVQESLSNAVKHAQAALARVVLRADRDRLELRVEDEGRGFDDAAGTDRLGILGMRERVEHLSGTFRIVSRPGGGTRVEARFPLANDENHR